jgi:hypothetical protein
LGRWRVPEPTDPVNGCWHSYESSGDQFVVWSSGPEATTGTVDDIHVFGGTNQ